MPANDVHLTAEWSARDDTKYHVEHYWEDVEEGRYTLHETEEFTGTTDTEARPVPKDYV